MKNIVLLSDGTGNGAAKQQHTNVWRLYQALDLKDQEGPDQTRQIAYYDDGVGSQEFLPMKILGGAFGFGLKRNVLELYKFLCRNYEEDKLDKENSDKIYLFGFSRGAFTVRMLAGLIIRYGLYTDFKDEEDLDKRARNNYYRLRTRYNQTPLSQLFCGLADIHENDDGTYFPKIEFMGVWDTVDAYGFPIDEMAIFWDKFIFPIRFPDQELSTGVKKACHALSIDDERQSFHPVLWDESAEKELRKKEKLDKDRIEQVWFAGVHSDVGGGYPMHDLSLVTLDWMMQKVGSRLRFIPEVQEEVSRHADPHGQQHDSRSGLGAYYRYAPRDIKRLCDDKKNKVHIYRPKIHRSVFERIEEGVTTYAPIALPTSYQIVPIDSSKGPYESPSDIKERMTKMKEVEEVVSWRKRLYILFLITSILFVSSRLFLEYTPGQAWDTIDCILDVVWIPFIVLLPDLLAQWFEVMSQNNGWAFGLLVTFVVLLVLKQRLWSKTQAKSARAWQALKQRKRRGDDKASAGQETT